MYQLETFLEKRTFDYGVLLLQYCSQSSYLSLCTGWVPALLSGPLSALCKLSRLSFLDKLSAQATRTLGSMSCVTPGIVQIFVTLSTCFSLGACCSRVGMGGHLISVNGHEPVTTRAYIWGGCGRQGPALGLTE